MVPPIHARQAPFLTTQTITAASTTYTTTLLLSSPTSTEVTATTTIAPMPSSGGPSSAVVGGAIIGSVLGFALLCVWWCYCGGYCSCFGLQFSGRKRRRNTRPWWDWGSYPSGSAVSYTTDSSPSSLSDSRSRSRSRVRIRVERRGGNITVPRRAAMRERDRRSSMGGESRVTFERTRSSRSTTYGGSGRRKKEPLFPWFAV